MKFSDAFIGTAVLLLVLVYATIYAVPAQAAEPTIDTFVGPVLTVDACKANKCIRHTYMLDTQMDICEQVAEDLNTNYRGLVASCEFQH
ncbi:hypothetical protein HOR97_gp54 [Agrobacterium phage Atu_ph03]|uniref:Uncharacterized protein n=1 Tax=Agrobacterium phage Atu_ph03 TaxID=2024262 RepID=A0A2L0UZ23_9CAUD|nr:hypothetical protein HOR97_gp54 [Agrobacterium phage Atu_ph03]AUZ94802.1 hypothetical protein [Agrobacterium phage Atu_ph03]